ncbi:MAG: metalloregulator ArsR/SmtB family transcription factor, partial [Chloroflexi bacterium]|nr:metalloregulator ArsR/SmtB family transcription factor [Chloroflexota bacterium]
MKSLELPPDDERLVQAFKALGNPMRFRILQTLAEQRACVCGDLVDLLPLAQSTVSGHLKVLKEAGLIRGTIEGPSTCYCLDPEMLTWWRRRVALLFTDLEPAAVGAAPALERSFAMSNPTPASSDAVKEAVSARYASIARRQLMIPLELVAAADACCAPAAAATDDACCAAPAGEAEACGAGNCATGYSAEDLASLPASVTGVSLGCGAPVGLAEARTGETVLDLGSGGGIDCFLAARRVGPEGRVIGVDMTPEMVRLARANAREVGAANVEFRLGEI